jgi:mRNA interferase MazF
VKDFDRWNKTKKKIDLYENNRFYKAREIWWCRLGTNIGYEQDGTGDKYDRPVLILKSFNKRVCLIIPLTKTNKLNKYLFHVGLIDGKKSKAIISQLRLVDTKRFTNRICKLEENIFNRIRKAIKDYI